MLSRHLEKKIDLIVNDDAPEFKRPIKLEYYLLECELVDYEELSGKKAYGIEIVKKENEIDVESKIIKNFSCCRESTKEILDKLASNSVTPVELPFILDDIIGV